MKKDLPILRIIPRLEIVKCSDLLVYEKHDPIRINKLLKKIPKDKVFINPIVVGKAPKLKKLIVLDGVNRLEALKKLSIRDILVQKVNYFDIEEIKLFNNHHYLKRLDKVILNKIRASFDFHLINQNDKEKLIRSNQFIAILRMGNRFFTLRKYENLFFNTNILNRLVNTYLGKTEIYRYSEFPYLPSMFPIEFIFHRFSPADIVKLAKSNKLLNSGITSHVASAYCLRINLHLNILSSKLSLKEKNNLLLNLIHRKTQRKEIRFIANPVYLFDEWRKEKI